MPLNVKLIELAKQSKRMNMRQACDYLSKSRSGIYKLMATDPTFPIPIKEGTSQQARIYFISEEILAWQASKIAERDDRRLLAHAANIIQQRHSGEQR